MAAAGRSDAGRGATRAGSNVDRASAGRPHVHGRGRCLGAARPRRPLAAGASRCKRRHLLLSRQTAGRTPREISPLDAARRRRLVGRSVNDQALRKDVYLTIGAMADRYAAASDGLLFPADRTLRAHPQIISTQIELERPQAVDELARQLAALYPTAAPTQPVEDWPLLLALRELRLAPEARAGIAALTARTARDDESTAVARRQVAPAAIAKPPSTRCCVSRRQRKRSSNTRTWPACRRPRSANWPSNAVSIASRCLSIVTRWSSWRCSATPTSARSQRTIPLLHREHWQRTRACTTSCWRRRRRSSLPMRVSSFFSSTRSTTACTRLPSCRRRCRAMSARSPIPPFASHRSGPTGD